MENHVNLILIQWIFDISGCAWTTLRFGDNTSYGSTSKGVVFEGGGQTVVAPSAGRVLFAGSYRSYGNILFIDACNIDVLVAGLEAVATQPEAIVAKGKPIGSIAGSRSVVYLEVRKSNRPIDPFGCQSAPKD